MEALYGTKIKIVAFLAIMISISFITAVPAYSAMNDNSDRLSSEQSGVFSPGYINAAKQQTESILRQESAKKSLWEKAVEYVQSKLSRKIDKEVNDEVTPVLRKPKSNETSAPSNKIAPGEGNQNLPGNYLDPRKAKDMMDRAIEIGASITTLDNGNAVTLWQENGKYYFSILNGSGEIQASREVQLDPAMQWNYVDSVIDLGDGRFMLNINSSSWNYDYASGSYYSYDGTSVQSLRTYGSNGEIESSQDYQSSYNYYYNYKTYEYRYDNDSTWVGNVTSLGDGTIAMTVQTYQYNYDYSGNTYSYSDKNSIRIMDGHLTTLNDYAYNNYTYDPAGSNYNYSWINGLASLGGGKFVVSTSEWGWDGNEYRDGTRFKVMDSSFNQYADLFIDNNYSYDGTTSTWSYGYMTNMISAGDGIFAVGWQTSQGSYDYTTGEYDYDDSLKFEVFDLEIADDHTYYLAKKSSESLGKAWDYSYDGTSYSYEYSYISQVKALGDGSIAIAINSYDGYYNYSTGESRWGSDADLKVMGTDGGLADISIGSLENATNRSISQITSLGGGNFGVVLSEEGYTNDGRYVSTTSSEQFSSSGIDLTDAYSLSSGQGNSSYDLSANPYQPYDTNSSGKSANTESSGKLSLDNTDKLDATSLGTEDLAIDATSNLSNNISSENLLTLLSDSLVDDKALSSYSIFDGSANYLNIMSTLSGILNNPTDDQKKIIDTISALLSDIGKVKAETWDKALLNEETDSIIRAAAAALLAQALPDLLSSQDISSLKGIFQALGTAKGSIMNGYEEATKPYYDQLLRDIAKNLDMLQLNNAISKSLTKEELDKMPRNQIDKIIEKLKQKSNRSFAEEYILQQEAKYRKTYIDPNKKILEGKMKDMMREFTARLSRVLEGTKK